MVEAVKQQHRLPEEKAQVKRSCYSPIPELTGHVRGPFTQEIIKDGQGQLGSHAEPATHTPWCGLPDVPGKIQVPLTLPNQQCHGGEATRPTAPGTSAVSAVVCEKSAGLELNTCDFTHLCDVRQSAHFPEY